MQQIKLRSTSNVYDFVFSLSVSTRLKRSVRYGAFFISYSSKKGKCLNFEGSCPVEQIWEIKIHNIVTSYDVWIHSLDKLTPFLWRRDTKSNNFCDTVKPLLPQERLLQYLYSTWIPENHATLILMRILYIKIKL